MYAITSHNTRKQSITSINNYEQNGANLTSEHLSSKLSTSFRMTPEHYFHGATSKMQICHVDCWNNCRIQLHHVLLP